MSRVLIAGVLAIASCSAEPTCKEQPLPPIGKEQPPPPIGKEMPPPIGKEQPPPVVVHLPSDDESLVSLVRAINAARTSRGLNEVAVELALNCAAKRHADEKICGHTGSDGSSPWDRAKSCGTSADGEIVACGQLSPQAAVDAWTQSPGHAAIMYDPNQTVIGVGMVDNFWVALFR